MPRFRLTVEYDGRAFVGWQRQENGPSVQQALEEAAAMLSGGVPVLVQGAGRTDAGVHATGQVCHLDLNRTIAPLKLREALNAHLKPGPVAVIDAAAVHDAWHARFDAVERRYLYRILNRRAPPVIDRGFVWHVSQPLNTEAMHKAAQSLVGHHDFTSFRASICQAKSPVKTLDALTVSRAGEEVHIRARARSFLHNQVRILVGTLAQVGLGRWAVSDVASALAAQDRAAAGPTAPPDGLALAAVRYPGEIDATDPPQGSWSGSALIGIK